MTGLASPSATILAPPRLTSTLLRGTHSYGTAALHERMRVTPVAPAIVIIVVAVAAFVALAVVIGAIAAYIWYCQSNGLGWPGLAVPGPSGGVYRLGCFR